MTDEEFDDLILEAKSRLIQGDNELKLRAHFSARGVSAADLERLVAAMDFSNQKAQAGRHLQFRVFGAVLLVVGSLWQGYLLFGLQGAMVFSKLAIGMVFIGLWFVTMGEYGAVGRR